MGAFDQMAGLGITLTRRPLLSLGEEDKSTPETVSWYGKTPPETTSTTGKHDPNTRYRPKPDPKYGDNDQTTAKVSAAQLRTGKPAQHNTK